MLYSPRGSWDPNTCVCSNQTTLVRFRWAPKRRPSMLPRHRWRTKKLSHWQSRMHCGSSPIAFWSCAWSRNSLELSVRSTQNTPHPQWTRLLWHRVGLSLAMFPGSSPFASGPDKFRPRDGLPCRPPVLADLGEEQTICKYGAGGYQSASHQGSTEQT